MATDYFFHPEFGLFLSAGDPGGPSHPSHHRKQHSSKSLSQPTIPEEGPEQEAPDTDTPPDHPPLATHITHSGATKEDSPRPQQAETKDLGAKPKEKPPTPPPPADKVRLKKSAVFRSADGSESSKNPPAPRPTPTFTSYVSSCDTGRAEPSVTERTVQKISKAILRGSKKARETSLTAQDSSGGGGGKDKKAHGQEKKSAQEKREMFKTQR